MPARSSRTTSRALRSRQSAAARRACSRESDLTGAAGAAALERALADIFKNRPARQGLQRPAGPPCWQYASSSRAAQDTPRAKFRCTVNERAGQRCCPALLVHEPLFAAIRSPAAIRGQRAFRTLLLDHPDADFRLHVRVQAHGYLVDAERLDRIVQLDLALLDFGEPLGMELLHDVRRGDRSEELLFLAHSRREGERDLLEPAGECLRR